MLGLRSNMQNKNPKFTFFSRFSFLGIGIEHVGAHLNLCVGFLAGCIVCVEDLFEGVF